ncbi:MAG: putative inorganic carbon transporter subunit DabA [Byssovorax sp.]
MHALLALVPLVAPLGLSIAAFIARRDGGARPRRALRATRAAAALSLIVAALTAGLTAFAAPLVSPLFGLGGLGLSVRLDGLSAVMFALVAILGAVVVRFSRRYLDGDPRQGTFLGDLSLTIACVMVLVVSGNLVQLLAGWITTSLSLHRLLLFYRERPGAVIAARKKFIVARLGDASLAVATALLVHQFGSADLGVVASGAASLAGAPELPLAVHVAAALIGLTAILKAAQFPTHGWLIEMQETPTPVSALLHAGILNGGTFLVVRLAGVVQLSPLALGALVLAGGFTALFASVVMVTDSRVKATLAWSSAAHMGFMLLLCGLGAYSVAIAHLVAHSFYKAHAFLSSGSAVDAARAARVPGKDDRAPFARVLLSTIVTALIVWAVATLNGVPVLASPTSAALALIMTLALSHLMARGAGGEASARVIGRTALGVTATALAFYALERAGAGVLARAVPDANERGPVLLGLIASVIAAFAAVTLLQLRLPGRRGSSWWAAAYVQARNGLYANAYFDRVVGAHRLPTAPRAPAPPADAMSATAGVRGRPVSLDALTAAIQRATRAVAPVWPLSTFVAVNPFLGLADRPIAEAARTLARTAGARLTMPRRFYAEALASGRIDRAHLHAALMEARARGESSLPADAADLEEMLRAGAEPPAPALVPTVADIVSARAGRDWNRIVVERLGAWAAAYFDEGHASFRSPFRDLPPYAAFRAEASLDRTPEVFGARGLRAVFERLPADATGAAAHALSRLGVPEAALDLYLQRLLAGIGGWAAYARHKVWKSELAGRPDATLEELLAIRLAWEVALLDAFAPLGAEQAWRAALATIVATGDASSRDVAIGIVLQAAYEKTWQQGLLDELAARADERPRRPTARPAVQAAFCIDVRSEVFRRALEDADPRCETLGFAGFFGFPVEYVPLGLDRGGAQCPVLLAPRGVVVESVVGSSDDEAARAAEARVIVRRARNAWKSFKTSAVACFGFVGPVGLAYLPKLIGDALGWTRTVPHPSRDGVDGRALLGPDISPRPHHGRKVGLGEDDKVAMAEGLLRGMSLTSGFARVVALIGHGSTTVNNPHAAGLDCGACGGHTGEANARIAAMVLNDASVRRALSGRGLHLPEDTVFVAGLHDTTTDTVTLFDRHLVPSSHAPDLARLDERLAAAGASARRVRAPRLGEAATDPAIDRRIMRRSRDWAEVRPEWGLAGCASFIAAPRHRTAGLDLDGRSFLHSYDWRQDEAAGFPVLELLMTAPMVVASWISLQYFASTVDNRTYGCGNKVLHNVVGTVGVLEGNGGDLRVGLPWQSVHDGERLVHEPLRLSVLIEAPVEAMSAILEKHAPIRALADNGWLHLFAIDDTGAVSHRYAGGLAWEPARSAEEQLAA